MKAIATVAWTILREFFSEPKVIVLFIMLLFSLGSTIGTYAYGKYKDAKIFRAQAKLEEADRRFFELRTKANNAIEEYGKLSKIVEKELIDNEELKKKIRDKQAALKKDIDKTNKAIDKMGIGALAAEFRKAGYVTPKSENKEKEPVKDAK